MMLFSNYIFVIKQNVCIVILTKTPAGKFIKNDGAKPIVIRNLKEQ